MLTDGTSGTLCEQAKGAEQREPSIKNSCKALSIEGHIYIPSIVEQKKWDKAKNRGIESEYLYMATNTKVTLPKMFASMLTHMLNTKAC